MLTLSQVKALISFYPAARTATANGTGVDLQGYLGANRNMKAVINNGTTSGTSPTLDVKMQESDDNSTFTDISGATATQITAQNTQQEILFRTQKRYVRAVATIGGTSPSFTFGVEILAVDRVV